MAGELQPLDEKFPIVGEDGRPTIYFIKWAQQRQIDIGEGITAEQALEIVVNYLAAHELQEGSGIQITPSGNISDSPTIAADVQEILDELSTTRGSIIYRGVGGWAALAPGTAGWFLETNGAGADPAWAVGGAGSIDWGDIGGTLSDQTDLQAVLDMKLPVGAYIVNPDITVAQIDASIGQILISNVYGSIFLSADNGSGNFGWNNAANDGGGYLGYFDPVSGRTLIGTWGICPGFQFDQDPYVTTYKIFHEGNLLVFTSVDDGLTPASGGGTLKFLRADSSWAVPPDTTYDVFDATTDGLVPASGGGTANFLRADGTWIAPLGGSISYTWYGGYRVDASNFPTIVHGATTGNTDLVLTDDADVGLIIDSGALIAGENMRFAMKAAPDHSQGWYLTAHFRGLPYPANYSMIGICLRDTTNVRSLNCCLSTNGAAKQPNLRSQTDTGFLANRGGPSFNEIADFWLRLQWVQAASTYHAFYSFDGKTWQEWATATKDAAFLSGHTPDQIGIGLYINQVFAGYHNYWVLDYWRQQQ